MDGKTPIALSGDEVRELLFGLLRSLYRFERREVEEFGLTYQQIFLLKVLARTSPLSVGTVAAALRLPMFGATRLVDQLQKMRLISRTSDKSDRRSRLVAITKNGTALVERIEEHALAIVRKNLDGFSAREIGAIIRVVRSLDAILGVEEEAGAV